MEHHSTGLSQGLSDSLGGLPKRTFYKGVAMGLVPMLTYINTQDVDVWCNKTYHQRPTLIKDDGAIPKYRSWCQQFYTD